ncbi:hypothetical protein [Enterobacter soli]|uniref:hypothetical protein n=1 Tax=Enterobacter soli TaxID=885040 RepID=UPI0037318BBB
MKQKFIEWFTKGNNGCSPAMADDGSFEREKTQHMFEAYQAGMAEGEARCAALASLEAEVVGTFKKGPCGYHPSFHEDAVPLYTAPPAPVSVPDVLKRLRSIVTDPRALPRRKEWISGQQYSYVLLENVEAMIDDACRAAMLQGAENADSRCGIQTAPALDSLPKNDESRCGNSPVIPDELIRRIAFNLVYLSADEKLRSDEDSLFSLVRAGIDLVRRELAAPQQEVNP